MQLLHQTPIVTSDAIESILNYLFQAKTSSIFSQALANVSVSDLSNSLGQIKLSPQFLNMEDTSNLWSA